jgi:hypothetical protein
MNEVIARIDCSTPTGKKIVRELEKHRRTVHLEYPVSDMPEGDAKLFTVREAFADLRKKVNVYYTDEPV